MDDPVGPAGKIRQPGSGGGTDPGGHAALAVLERGTHFAYHQHIGNEVKGEHEDPGHNCFQSLIGIAVDDVAETPDGCKGHEGQSLPGKDFAAAVSLIAAAQLK